ncbi:MAG: DUF3332 domain-containing protein [Oscillibacter sp.]|nr:DUF3332 domain-containing protein [Oscillibacter sp.]
MKKVIIKVTTIVLIAAMGALMSGCYGSFALTSKLHRWNGEVSNSKFVNELVFLGLCILPAYELACLGDALIFNSIEFWGGNNPIAMNADEVEEMDVLHEGQMYKMIKKQNNLTIASAEGENAVNFQYFPKEKAWYLMEGENKVKVVEMKDKSVFTYLPNQKMLVFDQSNMNLIPAEVMAAK